MESAFILVSDPLLIFPSKSINNLCIDTEGSFVPERVVEMAQALLNHLAGILSPSIWIKSNIIFPSSLYSHDGE